jgi:hypothetical protein
MPAFAAWPAVLRRPRWRNEGADCRFWVALCSSLNPPPTAADKAPGQALDEGSTTMLAEIFLLRMEAIYRRLRDRHPRATLGSSLLRCRVLLHACCG